MITGEREVVHQVVHLERIIFGASSSSVSNRITASLSRPSVSQRIVYYSPGLSMPSEK